MSNEHLSAGFELAQDYETASREARQSLELDTASYLGDLDEFEIDEEQKIELLETLWNIMRSMVEIGISIDICGQFFDGIDELPKAAPVAVDSGSTE